MKIFKIVVKSAIIATYIGMIAILILLALTPGEKSSDISNSVGDKFNEVTPDVIEPEVPVVNVESVEIKYLTVGGTKYTENISIFAGQSGELTCKVLPNNATNPSLNYSSSDDNVVKVYSYGKIVATGEGTATITVTSAENGEIMDTITVSVSKIFAEGVELDNIPDDFHVGESHKLDVKFTPSNTSDKSVTWTSSDPSVVTVNANGSLSAKKEGTAIITVTSKENPALTDSVEITVLPKIIVPVIPVGSVSISGSNGIGYIGSDIKLTAKLFPANSVGKVEWSSSNNSIATVSQKGVVTCLSAGEVTITVKCGSAPASSINIVVKEVLSKNINLEFKDINTTEDGGYTLKQGNSGKVIATLDENATVLTITYSSSDEEVAIIRADGVIEALKGGTTTITISTSYDGETTEVSFDLNIERITLKDTIENYYSVFRKSFGHYGAFLVLGIFGSLTYYIIFKKDIIGRLIAFGVNMAAGFGVAGLTEILQLPYFTEGRYCSWKDVMLDFKGYCTSSIPLYAIIIGVYILEIIIKREIERRKNSSDNK